MSCQLCQSSAKFKEAGHSSSLFCDAFCQEGWYIGQKNPMEITDTMYEFLLRVPPSDIFRFYGVDRTFNSILKNDTHFKRDYVKKWPLTNEFLVSVYVKYKEWLPFVGQLTDFQLIMRFVKADSIGAMKYLLRHVKYAPEIYRHAARTCEGINMFKLLLQYVQPDHDLLQDSIRFSRIDKVEVILQTGAILDVVDEIRFAVIWDKLDMLAMLERYQDRPKRIRR